MVWVLSPSVTQATPKQPPIATPKQPPIATPKQPPFLIVDKCPEFCPPGIKGPIETIKMCTQALIPVPGKPGWYWTDGCKTKTIKIPSNRKP